MPAGLLTAFHSEFSTWANKNAPSGRAPPKKASDVLRRRMCLPVGRGIAMRYPGFMLTPFLFCYRASRTRSFDPEDLSSDLSSRELCTVDVDIE